MSRWIQTFTGKHFPLDPVDPSKVCIEDIAHALSLLCRFGGHIKSFYSVAQHSVMVSHLVSPRNALRGLLHDAAEAYVQDLVHDVKRQVGEGYSTLEARVAAAIDARFGIVYDDPIDSEDVHACDLIALATERRDLLGECETPWTMRLPEPEEAIIEPLNPPQAEELFMRRFRSLA